jgi:hypothetical protein
MAEDENAKPSPAEQVSRLYEDLEAQGAKASEELVGSAGFTSLLARAAENVAALTKLSGDTMDIVLRNLRLAGRRDVVSLSRQLARTEDKLERVLQEVEELRDELGRAPARPEDAPGTEKPARATRSRSTGNNRPARAPTRRRKDSS